jgi:hypothetical protein
MPESIAGKKPSQKIDRCNGHADAEEHACKHAFRPAFPKSEGKTGDDDSDERKASGDRAGEGCLEYAHGVFPRGSARLGKDRRRQYKQGD